jgi:hypothetical protein
MAKKKKKDPLENWADGTAQWARNTTAGQLKESGTPKALREVAEAAPKIAAEAVKIMLKVIPPDREIACKAGCSWCCTQTVFVNAV